MRKRIAGLSTSTLERFVLRVRRMVRLRDAVNLLVTNSAEVRSLNRRFRGADKPTDVLSFPYDQVEVLPIRKRVAGDVAISADIARENAKSLGHSLPGEVKILALHGILHLAGFDHENDHGEMARKEIQLRRRLKLEGGGLIERTETRARKSSVRSTRVNRSGARRKTA